MKKTLLLLFSLVLALTGCKYDDSSLWEEINAQKAKITALEGTVSAMNSNLGTLQSLVSSVQGQVTVNAVTKNDDGYTIYFSDGKTAKIKDGSDGEDGKTPQIGAKADSDGNYYWTVNGSWLLDSQGAKVSTSNTPKVKIENDQWMVSYDNGANWTKIEGQGASASMFKDVETNDSDAIFTLYDGTVITVPLTGAAPKLQLVFDESVFAKMRDGELLSTAYNIIAPEGAKVSIETFESTGWTVTFHETSDRAGRVSIKAPAKVTDAKILFLLTDDKGGSFVKIINIGLNESAKPTVKTSYEVDYTGGEIVIPIASSTVTIGDTGENWMEVVSVGDEVVLKLSENDSYDWRTARVTLEDGTVITITQLTKDALFLTKSDIQIDGRRQIVPVVVNTNITGLSVTVTEGSDWLSATPSTRALSQKIYNFTAKRNTSETERTAKVEISGKNLKVACTITQSVFEGDPSMDVTEASAAEEGEEVELKPSIIVAGTTDGYVVSDGSSYLFVTDPNHAPQWAGDSVKFSSTATSFNSMPALESVQGYTVTKEKNSILSHLSSAKDITSSISSYSSGVPTVIKVTGDFYVDNSGSYYLIVKGSGKRVDIYKPASYTAINENLTNHNVTITGIYYGASGGAITVIAMKRDDNGATIVEGDQVSVAQFLAIANTQLSLKVGPGLVIAAGATSFLMDQDGAKILVYQPATNPKVGDKVVVEGKYTTYPTKNGDPQPQVASGAKVTVESQNNTVTHPDANNINSTFDSYTSSTRDYVTFKGKLNISGNYYNITVGGASVSTGSILKPAEDISSLNEQEVTVKGYYLYHTNNKKYLYVIATQINDITLVGPEAQGGGGGDTPGGTVEGNTIVFSSLNIPNGEQYNGSGNDKTIVKATDFNVCFGSGGNDGKYYTTGEGIRTYGGGYIRVESSTKTITKIVYTFHKATASNNPTYPTGSNYSISTGSISLNEATATWTGSGSSVVFSRPSGGGHWRLQKIEVTFAN